MIRLLAGDARDVLLTLPAESVQCCVTSPPYFGLRDYGTALWDGGEAGCDHKRSNYERGERATRGNIMERTTPYRDACGKCGAVRVDRQIGLEPTPDCGKRGMFRLRADLTEAQREFVVRRLVSGVRRDVLMEFFEPAGDTVLDPFIGAGTTALVADRLQRDCIGVDLNVAYTEMALERCRADAPLFTSFPPAEDPEETRMGDLFQDMAAD